MRPSDLKSLRCFLEAIRNELYLLRNALKESSASISNQHIAQQELHNEKREKIVHAIDKLANQESESANTSEANQQRRHRQNLRPQWLTAIATSLAFVAAAIYAWEAHKTLCQIQSQTELMQKQVESSAGALVYKQFRISWPESDKAYLSVILDNRGHSLASAIKGKIYIREISVLSGKTMKTFEPWEFSVAGVNPSGGDIPLEEGTYLPITEEGFTMPTAIQMTGSVNYFNGFTNRSDDLCYYVTGAMKFRNKAGVIQQTNGTSVLSCGALDPQIAYWRDTQKQISSQ